MYYSRNNPMATLFALMILGIFALSIYIVQNIKWVVLGLLVLLLVFGLYKLVMYMKFRVERKEYQERVFFKETGIAYKLYRKSSDLRFQALMYETLTEKFGSDLRILHGLEFFEDSYGNRKTRIDLTLVHLSGVYVIDVDPSMGYVIGSKDDKVWSTGHGAYTSDSVSKTYQNKILSNDIKVKALKNVYNGEVKNRVVFRETSDIRVNAEEVLKFSGLIDELKYADRVHEYYKLESIAEDIKKVSLSYKGNTKSY